MPTRPARRLRPRNALAGRTERIAAAARAKAEEEAQRPAGRRKAAEEARCCGSRNAKRRPKLRQRPPRRPSEPLPCRECRSRAQGVLDGSAASHPGRGPEKVAACAARNWVAEFDLPEDRVLLLIVAAIAAVRHGSRRPAEDRHVGGEQMAKALRCVSVPGMKAVNRSDLRPRGPLSHNRTEHDEAIIRALRPMTSDSIAEYARQVQAVYRAGLAAGRSARHPPTTRGRDLVRRLTEARSYLANHPIRGS